MTLPAALAEVLRCPPRSHSPVAIWWWSGEPLRADRLRWQLRRFADGGVYQLVILNLAPSAPMFGGDADDPPFFSEAWWSLLDQVCTEAEALGVRLWFYDQLGFSGAAVQADLVHGTPEFAGRWLEPDGTVTARGFDYLSREACAALLDRVHGEYERRLGDRLGGVVAGSFQDELPTLPTWSADFATEFHKRRGYELAPHLPALWRPADGAGRIRRDYQLTRAELAEEAFFRPLADWHARHGLLCGCDQQDAARAGHPVDGVRLYADYPRTHRWFSAPGSDHHGDARLHSSLAHLYGRPRTWIEAFHSSGWGGTLEETFDWLLPWLRAGANLYNPHAVYYTTKGGWWEWAPPSTDWRQPYWAHHRVFAEAVTRLCAALSLGRHACDVAVLVPTATVQAGTSLHGADTAAWRAQETYLALVGDMTWFRAAPGALDRLGLDADAIDEDSVGRAVVRDGRLRVAGEAYAAVVLPAVTVLDAAAERRLCEFAAAGGLVVAVGTQPPGVPARLVPTVDGLGEVLGGLRRVEAPVPPLVREVDGTTLVFLQAAFPGAGRVTAARPEDRGFAAGWSSAEIDFDPERYARGMPVRVHGVTGTPQLVDPFTGAVRALPRGPGGDLVVPFDDGPAALLVFDGTESPTPPEPGKSREWTVDGDWTMDLVETLDDRWGDFGRPSAAALHRWAVEHRLDRGAWQPAHATFGPHGRWRVPGGAWQPAVYSTSRGIRKDPIHHATLGPKGHVPEEFLDFGPVAAGDRVDLHADLTVAEPGFLRLGAAAAKLVRLNGRRLDLDDRGYLALGRETVPPGAYRLEASLTAEEPLRLRAHLSVVRDRAAATAPEWLAGGDGPAEFTVSFRPAGAVLQVASPSGCRILVNGIEVGRQGGFDPYEENRKPRARRYDLGPSLRPGDNELVIQVDRAAAGVLADGCVSTGPGWWIRQDGRTGPARTRRAQSGDPGALHLPRRPHPLPETGWLSGQAGDGTVPAVLAAPGRAGGVEWLRFGIPPGATALRVPLRGEATLYVDGIPVAAGTGALAAPLPGGRGVRVGTLRVRTEAGHSGGAILTGPIAFTAGPGPIRLGNWEDVGLPEYSGGVRYRTGMRLGERCEGGVVDLGRVRGTAQVAVDGNDCGVRVCSPYRFPVGRPLGPGRHEIEVTVYGTLAPYLDAVSPTHFVFPGQRVTGLFGPVRLIGD
jgi:hypothetical protein